MALSKRQLRVLDMLFLGTGIDSALDEAKISKDTFHIWLKTKQWQDAFQKKVDYGKFEAQTILSSHIVFASLKLVSLMDSESESVKRQACLDILEMKPLIDLAVLLEKVKKQTMVSDDKANAVMKILAEKKN